MATIFRDSKNRTVAIGDILKVFHFIGAVRRQRHYMYKVAVEKDGHLVAMDIKELALLGFDKAHTCRMEYVGDFEILEKD